MELTVKDLIEALQKYDGNLPVYFGVNLKFEIDGREDEFDDWLEFKEAKTASQAIGKRGDMKTRKVLSIELKY